MDAKTSNDNGHPVPLITGDKRNKQVIPTGSLSSSESEGSLHLSDQSDSLHISVCNTGELGEQSDREFLQQQIKILKMPFQLEKDSPALCRIKGIPHCFGLVNTHTHTKDIILQIPRRSGEQKLTFLMASMIQNWMGGQTKKTFVGWVCILSVTTQ